MNFKKILKFVIRKIFIFLYMLTRFCFGLGGLIAFYETFNVGLSLDIILNIGLLFFTIYPLFNWTKLLK